MIQKKKRKEIIQKLLTKEILSIDTETTGTEPMEAELVGMSFSDAENRAYYVPVPANRDEALKIVNEFRPLYENENSMKVGQNIKYDMIVLQNYGVQVKENFSTPCLPIMYCNRSSGTTWTTLPKSICTTRPSTSTNL